MKSSLPSRKSRRKSKALILNFIRKFLITAIIAGILILFAASVYFVIITERWRDFEPEDIKNVYQTSFIYDSEGNLITDIHGLQNRINVSLTDIPLHVQHAFIAVEDVRFYTHPGFDIKRMFGALFQNIRAGRLAEGASTITQQVARNSLLSKEKTFSRKFQEIYLAYRLENNFTKDQILQLYLNLIYFGEGAHGLQAASMTYFGKPVGELSIAEGALLAGIPRSPTRYSPFNNLENSMRRRNLVINLMEEHGFITKKEAQKALSENITLAEVRQQDFPHRFFLDMALDEAADILNIYEEELISGGFRIYTTLDTDLQVFAEKIYRDNRLFPKSPGSQASAESALVVLHAPSGEIRALLGGRLIDKPVRKGLNRAVHSRRQPGSSIKPILVYLPAIEYYDYTPVSFIEDAPVSFGDYSPSNYDAKHRGWVTLRYSLAHSINIPAVRILHDIGVNSAVSLAKRLGIPFEPEDDNNLSIALGGMHKGVTPLELTRAYSVLADNGVYKDYSTIRRIEDVNGLPLYERNTERMRLISEESAFIMNNMLKSSVNWGTASRLSALALPLAAKTGTVQLPEIERFEGIDGVRDAWIVAYNPDYVVTVWMGFDEATRENYLPPNAVGGTYPANIASLMFRQLFQNKEPSDFKKPLGVVEVMLDSKSLEERHKVLLASHLTPSEFVVSEYFTRQNAPTQPSDYWVVPQTPLSFDVTSNIFGLPVISFRPRNTFAAHHVYRIEYGNENPVLVHRSLPGESAQIEWTDTFVARGREYGYFVVPVHPEIRLRGRLLQGAPTRTDSIIVPVDYETTLEDMPG
jgi:1A family penicillin-binding protein